MNSIFEEFLLVDFCFIVPGGCLIFIFETDQWVYKVWVSEEVRMVGRDLERGKHRIEIHCRKNCFIKINTIAEVKNEFNNVNI